MMAARAAFARRDLAAFREAVREVPWDELGEPDAYGRALLHHAGALPEFARVLLDAGADPDVRDGRGHTPLHCLQLAFVSEQDGRSFDTYDAARGLRPRAERVKWETVSDPLSGARLLTEYGADPFVMATGDRVPVYLQARPSVREILREGALAGARDDEARQKVAALFDRAEAASEHAVCAALRRGRDCSRRT